MNLDGKLHFIIWLKTFIVNTLVGTDEDRSRATYIIDLQLALVLFLQVSRQVVENRSAAAPVGVEAWRASYLMHLQTRLLVCGGDGNTLRHNMAGGGDLNKALWRLKHSQHRSLFYKAVKHQLKPPPENLFILSVLTCVTVVFPVCRIRTALCRLHTPMYTRCSTVCVNI